MSRDALVAAARESIRRGSRSFHMASRLFDRATRERAWLLYCWCRHCDDSCDGQAHGFRTGATGAGTQGIEALTRRALAGERTGELPFDGLALLLRECPIPHRMILDHLRGFALDAEGWRPADEADLFRYCYHVAGVVGCMMAVVMGVDPEDEATLGRASSLGIAFQLCNIARDAREDLEAGRCYLPADLVAAQGLDTADPLRPGECEKLAAIVSRLVARAALFEAEGLRGVSALPFRSRWAVLAAARIYGRIGRRVAALGTAAWDRRTVVPRSRKLAFMMTSLVAAGAAGRRLH
jgi:15-cis-phytoene synthase